MEILGTSLQKNKNVRTALTRVYGVGDSTADQVCKSLGFLENQKTSSLDGSQLAAINDRLVDSGMIFNDVLKKQITTNKKRLIDIKSYRGLRLARGLPARGQRTHTNAKTPRKRL